MITTISNHLIFWRFKSLAITLMCFGALMACQNQSNNAEDTSTILLILDGMACGTLENLDVPNLQKLKDEGVYYPSVHLILPAHLERNEDRQDPGYYPWGCSLPNIPLMTGTIFVGLDGLKDHMIQHSFTESTTAFVVNDGAYEELRYGFDIYRRYGSEMEDQFAYTEVFDESRKIITDHHPEFMRIHLQGTGSAGYLDMNAGISIWDEHSNYHREIMRADTALGDFMQWLRETGRWNNTRLVVMGDHGQNDEGWHAPYKGQAQIQPVIIFGPGIKENKVFDYAESIDICTTITHWHGVSKPKFSQGRVLTEAIQGQPDTAPETGPVQRLNALLLEHHVLMDKISDAQMRQIADLNRDFYTIETIGSWHRHFESIEELISHQEDVLAAMKKMIGT